MSETTGKTTQPADKKQDTTPTPEQSSPQENAWEIVRRSLAPGDAPLDPRNLTPKTVLQFQRTLGNRFVTHWVQRQQPHTSPVTRIQRRVPEVHNIDDEALETADDAANAVNIAGLRVLLRRIVDQITDAALRDRFTTTRVRGRLVSEIIETGTARQLMAVIRTLDNDPELQPYVLDQTTGSSVGLRRSGDMRAVEAVLQDVCQQLTEISMTNLHDQHLQDVFGNDPAYGWQQAKVRFVTVGNELLRALRQECIYSDRTGASEEMDVGALTSFDTQIQVSAAYIDNPDTPAARSMFVHEGFHFSFANVMDEGGYSGQESFRTASASAKFHNADHYAEVYRRVIGIGERGVVYVPASAATRTPNELAYDNAVTAIRRAWDVGIDIHNDIRYYYNLQRNRRVITRDEAHVILHHSHLFRLTYHQRYTDNRTPINEIDIALAEGVVRLLSAAITTLNTLGATLPDARDWPATRRAYLRHGLAAVGVITDSTDRDIEMVEYCNQEGDALLTRDTLPPPPLL
jgi:hypothetical protein